MSPTRIVSFFLEKLTPDDLTANGGEMIFPVRRGDERVFEWSGFGASYDGFDSVDVAVLLSESWPVGDAAPTLLSSKRN
jgi:hypothetical protein